MHIRIYIYVDVYIYIYIYVDVYMYRKMECGDMCILKNATITRIIFTNNINKNGIVHASHNRELQRRPHQCLHWVQSEVHTPCSLLFFKSVFNSNRTSSGPISGVCTYSSLICKTEDVRFQNKWRKQAQKALTSCSSVA